MPMAFPCGPCCPLYLLRMDVHGEKRPSAHRKRMPLPSLTRAPISQKPPSDHEGALPAPPKTRKSLPTGREGFLEERLGSCAAPIFSKSRKPHPIWMGFSKERRRHTLPQYCSTICAGGLNFSVRDGKR
jgi:hypothetical protein